MDDLSVTEPAAAGELASAVTQPISVVTTGQCAQCAAPLAHDQRYCLHCGEPGPHVSGPLSAKPAAEKQPPVPPFPPGSTPSVLGIPGAPVAARNNSVALIAGVGVLLLAMGVGVLIGRASAGSAKAPPAQVISLGGAGAGAGAATAPATTTTETPAASSKKKVAKAKEPAGTGSSITKPAPPSAAQNLRSGGSGQSYEQRSKNLPNVVSTG
ncbi:MAG TPA: hypothetical protein VFV03_07340 [Solirubrobacteraceae bacterium]|nr:hypothetical protein [Solirubrobacteraceae bacterium]